MKPHKEHIKLAVQIIEKAENVSRYICEKYLNRSDFSNTITENKVIVKNKVSNNVLKEEFSFDYPTYFLCDDNWMDYVNPFIDVLLEEDRRKAAALAEKYKDKKFMVRANDFSLWELDESNNAYRHSPPFQYTNGELINAIPTWTHDFLIDRGFIDIDSTEISTYAKKHALYFVWQKLRFRDDHHGGGYVDELVGEFYDWLNGR